MTIGLQVGDLLLVPAAETHGANHPLSAPPLVSWRGGRLEDTQGEKQQTAPWRRSSNPSSWSSALGRSFSAMRLLRGRRHDMLQQ